MFYVFISKYIFFWYLHHIHSLEDIVEIIIDLRQVDHSNILVTVKFVCKYDCISVFFWDHTLSLMLHRIFQINLYVLKLVSMHFHIGDDCILHESLFLFFLFSLIFYTFLLVLKTTEIPLSFLLIDVELFNFCLFKNFISDCLKWPKPLEIASLTLSLPMNFFNGLLTSKNFRLKLRTNIFDSLIQFFIL